MKQVLIAVLLLLAIPVLAQRPPVYLAGSTCYSVAKGGLFLRQSADPNAAILEKIPYGASIVIVEKGDTETLNEINIEGIRGYWEKVKYNGKTGFVAGPYLFPVPAPKEPLKDMNAYLRQISVAFGNKLTVQPKFPSSDGGMTVTKQLYRNGAASSNYQGWEFSADAYHLPGFTIEQAFLLARMLPEFKYILDKDLVYPTESKTIRKNDIDYKITVEKTVFENGDSLIRKITIEFNDTGFQTLEIYTNANEAVIYYESGI